MKVIEMPSSISDPALKCPLFVKDERNHEEIGQKQGKLMAALNIIPDKSEMDWKVIQCEARFPVWDHRKTVKVELSLSEAPWTIENETKVSKALMEKFKFQRFETLPPEVTFDASAHYAENEAVCIHLKCKQGRKNIQNRVFSFLEYFLLRVLETELQQVAELKNESD